MLRMHSPKFSQQRRQGAVLTHGDRGQHGHVIPHAGQVRQNLTLLTGDERQICRGMVAYGSGTFTVGERLSNDR